MITAASAHAPDPPTPDLRDPAAWARLTPRERVVLTLLAQGRAPKQAAWELAVTIATVRSHIASAKRKTGARTLQQLVGAFAESAPPAAVADLVTISAGVSP